MKGSLKSISITCCLLLLLGIVIYIEIAAFISGPIRSYELKVQKQEIKIKETYPNISDIYRHVFQYTVYSGSIKQSIIWFNENGEVITTRKKENLSTDEVSKKAINDYQMKDFEVNLGYGYDNPVYVIVSKNREVLLDFDSLDLVYDLRKGVASEMVE